MVSITEILKGLHTGKPVELRGWIYRTRSVGGKAFVVVRDATGIVQVAISRDGVPAAAFAAAQKALIESAVIVHGGVVQDKRAPGGFEIRADDFKVLCRTRSQAIRMNYAIRDFLKTRLHLETSEGKSKVINLKKIL